MSNTQAVAPKQAEPTIAELQARIKQLEAAASNGRKTDVTLSNGLSIRFNRLGTMDKQGKPNKGTISIFGFGKFPQTYYVSQLGKLLAVAPEIAKAVAAEVAKGNTLAVKAEE